MADATVTSRFEGVLAEENVILTVSDGETFTTKLSSIALVQCTYNDNDASTNAITYTVSGRVVTFHVASLSDKKIAVTIKGRL